MVGLQTLDLAIGVRVPASQINRYNNYGQPKGCPFLLCITTVSLPGCELVRHF